MNKKHLTGIASVATIALISTTAAWGADVDITGGSYKSEGKTLTLQSNADYQEIAITDEQAASINSDVVEASGTLKIVVDRGTVPATTYSTIMLPVNASIDNNDSDIDGVFSAKSFYKDADDCYAIDMEPQTSIKANTPYIIKFKNEKHPTKLNFTATSSVTKISSDATYSAHISGSCYEMTGVYKVKKWDEDRLYDDYGFSADDQGNVSAGQFVRIQGNANCTNLGDCVTLLPARAYLTCTGVALAKSADASEPLPEVIKVRFLSKSGETLSIGKMNTRTGDIQMQDNYYDLKGRKLNSKPQNKVMYVNKKVLKH